LDGHVRATTRIRIIIDIIIRTIRLDVRSRRRYSTRM
jgi:hypothetical protein